MEKEREYLELARNVDGYVIGRELFESVDGYFYSPYDDVIELPSSFPVPPSLQLKPGEGPVRVQLRRVG